VAASLLGALGLLSLILAAVGLYSVMSYTVTERSQEIGIRMAMGAHPADVLAMVLRRGMLLTFAGLVAGATAGIFAAPLISDMLVGVSPTDPAALSGAALFLACIAAVATLVPALRATRVDPIRTLRSE
jgi:ABC-type antimicrobial peptide transport system permease subunit